MASRIPYSISIVLPVYNESERLPSTLRDIKKFMRENTDEFELIIVDDGSSDNTFAVVRELSGSLGDSARVLRHEVNRGKGAAVQTGFRAARKEYVVYMDADHSTKINELLQLPTLAKTGGEVFASSRYLPGSRVLMAQPWQRVLVSRISNIVIRLCAVPGIKDTQNGFKILSKRSAQNIASHMLLHRWAFDVELLYLARRFGYKVVEFPVAFSHTPGSKLNIVRDVRNTVGEFFRFTWNRLTSKYPRRTKPARRVPQV